MNGTEANPQGSGGSGAAPAPRHEIPAYLYVLTIVVFIPLIALVTAGFGSVAGICGLWDRSGRQQHWLARRWAATMLRVTFSPVQVVGEEKLVRYPVAVYDSNHLSYMDTQVLFAKLPFQFRILAKQGLWKIPFVGWYLERSGLPIDEASPRSAVAGLLRGVAALKAGMPLVIYPEGGRTPDGEIKPFLPGAFFLAIKAQVDIVPVALVGTYELLPMNTYHIKCRPLEMRVGEPISTTGMTMRDLEAVSAKVKKALEDLYYAESPVPA